MFTHKKTQWISQLKRDSRQLSVSKFDLPSLNSVCIVDGTVEVSFGVHNIMIRVLSIFNNQVIRYILVQQILLFFTSQIHVKIHMDYIV